MSGTRGGSGVFKGPEIEADEFGVRSRKFVPIAETLTSDDGNNSFAEAAHMAHQAILNAPHRSGFARVLSYLGLGD